MKVNLLALKSVQIKYVVDNLLWRSHVVSEDFNNPQLIVKVQREKGALLRLQFVMKLVMPPNFYIVLISHYALDQIDAESMTRNYHFEIIYPFQTLLLKQSRVLKNFKRFVN